jgi:hypothetical protein
MNIIIKSRSEVEQLNKPIYRKVAIISVRDADSEDVKLQFQPDYLLKLRFNDVGESVFEKVLERKYCTKNEKALIKKCYNMFTDEQAEEICKFFYQINRRVDILVCQCENGQAISSAIAAAIMEMKNQSGIRIFADEQYNPNKMVFRMIMEKHHELNRT